MPHAANHSPHRAAVINDHLIWMPRGRKKILVGIAAARWIVLLAEIATQYRSEIRAVAVMPDPMHR